ncbi:MAG: methyltransferase domain-containing protein [Phycisphaerae bacterium]|jgi:SAM-dependent methyltransferase
MTPDPAVWNGQYKLPWNDPAFSRRMLAEHLSQEHDLASRRTDWIDRQVDWLHARLLGGKPARVLDLGCGPGFYVRRLAPRGHQCHGIDFGPASIEYARQHHPANTPGEYILADVRDAEFGGPHDLAMMLYGELNVFSPAEAAAIIGRARASLAPGGVLIAEVQTPESVEAAGRAAPSEQRSASGLFSDRPHRCRTENRWLPQERVTVQTFHVTDDAGGPPQEYRSTTKAWPDDELVDLFLGVGFAHVTRREDWPSNTDSLALWLATTEEVTASD